MKNIMRKLGFKIETVPEKTHPFQVLDQGLKEEIMRESAEKSKVLVLKFGTNAITTDRKVDDAKLAVIANETSELVRKGKYPVIVTSGAVSCGMEVNWLQERPDDVRKLQDLAAEGQPILMEKYRKAFLQHGLGVWQILPTHHNFSTRKERNNITSSIRRAFMRCKVPILNTNDPVTNEELVPRFGNHSFTDNDPLAALVTHYLEANMLFIFSNEGDMGSGGKDSKERAIDIAVCSGATVVICKFEEMHDALDGKSVGKVFALKETIAW